MTRRRAAGAACPPPVASAIIIVLAVVATACGGSDGTGPAAGADTDRPPQASMSSVQFVDVASDVGLDFRHGAFRWGTAPDPNSYMGAGVCWIDADADGWLDLFVVDTWSNGEWGRWRAEGTLPSTRLFRNERGTFVDVTDETGAGQEVRGNGCVAADLDGDGFTDLYVTTERDNVLMWNDDGDGFVVDDGTAGVQAQGWQAGAAAGDINGDGLLDLFVAGYADLNRRIPEATKGFPNTFVAEPDLLYLQQPAAAGQRPTFVDVAGEAGIESDQIDYGLGVLLSDIDLDGDLDLYVANDTNPNRLYENVPIEAGRDPENIGFRLIEVGRTTNVGDDNSGSRKKEQT